MNEVKFLKKGLSTFFKENKENVGLNAMVNVKNIHHGSDENSQYIHQWQKYKNKTLRGCANLNCSNHESYDSLVGAHVVIIGEEDKQWYITPLCHVCNRDENNDVMTVYRKDLAPYSKIKDIEV